MYLCTYVRKNFTKNARVTDFNSEVASDSGPSIYIVRVRPRTYDAVHVFT